MTEGIHHITAIASDAKTCLHFYTETLGLRLVKKTVNQDDVATYHLFFGDRFGHSGMDLTFFIFQPAFKGIRGTGQVTTISLAIPDTSLGFWKKRFEKLNIKHDAITEKFGKNRIMFYDFDDQRLELVESTENELNSTKDIWTTREVTRDVAIHNFHSATLSITSPAMIEPILIFILGYELEIKDRNTYLYSLPKSYRAKYLEIHEEPSLKEGINAAGTVHHIAFRVKTEKEQLALRTKILELGLYPTEVIDRFYFKSVYFRTPAGILFEIATDGPGFTADEKEDDLGNKLALPPFLEHEREMIESQLPRIS